MRVLWVVEATGGGTARHVVDLASALSESGLELHLVYSPLRSDALWRQGRLRLEAAGVSLYPLPMRPGPHPADLPALYRLRGLLRRLGPFALVHGHSSKGGALARLLAALGGPPAVYTPHALATLRPGPSRPLLVLAERALCRYTAVLVAVSPEEAAEARRLGCPPSRVRLIPNGLDLERFKPVPPREARRRLGLPAGLPVVGFLGRLSPQKDPHLLLRAFRRLVEVVPDALLALAGEGPLLPSLEGEVRRRGLASRVRFLGRVAAEVALPAFDALALTSRYEGFPYVLLEALAAGVPVVATRVGGAALALGEAGALVAPGDAETLARELARLLADPSLRRARARAAKARARRFSLSRMLAATQALYRRVAAKPMGL